jgi:penicillin-binding protein 1C
VEDRHVVGFRDAWTAGVAGDHVLVVWIGNFDGTSNPAFIGVQAAAPLFFSIVDAIRAQARPSRASAPHARRAHARRGVPRHRRPAERVVPRARGDVVHSRQVPDPRLDAAPARARRRAHGRSRVRGVGDDALGGSRILGADMQRLFRDAGLPRRDPPRAADCGNAVADDEEAAPTILTPVRGVTYALRISKPVALALNANTAPGPQYWFADSGFIGEAPAGQAIAWMPPGAGHYRIRVGGCAGAQRFARGRGGGCALVGACGALRRLNRRDRKDRRGKLWVSKISVSITNFVTVQR